MRAAFVAFILSAAAPLIAGEAAAQRWCAISNQGSSNCGFATSDLCRSEVAGNGGNCVPQSPVGHRQPARLSDAPAGKDDPKLDALIERENKKNNSLILCRGC